MRATVPKTPRHVAEPRLCREHLPGNGNLQEGLHPRKNPGRDRDRDLDLFYSWVALVL